MDPQRWARIESLYHAALAKDGRQRSAYLAARCAQEPALRHAMETLIACTDVELLYPAQRDRWWKVSGDAGLHLEIDRLQANHDPGLERTAVEAGHPIAEGARLQTGQKLGRYEIVSFLAAGGMGAVYRAWDPRTSRGVAIKICAGRLSGHFSREVRAVAALNHPNICTLYDVGSNYLVMELVEGQSPKGPLPIEVALNYARQIASALDAAHEGGIVHCDLKPGNIKIRPDGAVKVLDFGLARVARTLLGSTGSDTLPNTPEPATHVGWLVGTPPYMSPEQACGKPLDKRADIWAFGVVLYQMITGRTPFPGETVAEVLGSIMELEPDWSSIPENVQRLLRRCLERDPRRRLRDIADFDLLIEEAPIAPVVGFAGKRSKQSLSVEPSGPERAQKSIAVLPFANLAAEASDYFSDGLTEELIHLLTCIPLFRVVAWEKSSQFRGPEQSLTGIWQRLKIGSILRGSVRRMDSRIRVTCQLIDAESRAYLWSETYDRQLQDSFAIQEEIAHAIVDALALIQARRLGDGSDAP